MDQALEQHVHNWTPTARDCDRTAYELGVPALYPERCACGCIKRYDGVILPAVLT